METKKVTLTDKEANALVALTQNSNVERRYLRALVRKGYAHEVNGRVYSNYVVADCTGAAHTNAHIDHCMVCLPWAGSLPWGKTLQKAE